MSIYIDADKALALISRVLGCMPLVVLKSFEANSIDIVRCGECKHWHEKDGLTYCDRIDYGYGYKPNDFCSYGEREDNEGHN